MTQFTDLPYEIRFQILKQTTDDIAKDVVTYTFGLTGAPAPGQKPTLQRYVRGPVRPDMLLWDATSAIRHVCRDWHDWALGYIMRDVYLWKWRGSERWVEISQNRTKYDLYELMEKPSGVAVYRDPYQSLVQTVDLFSRYPQDAASVRRIWFDGFFVAETSRQIFDALKYCVNLESVTLPWVALRHGTADDWKTILDAGKGKPLRALHLTAVDLTETQTKDAANSVDNKPLDHFKVDFSKLRRLKISGNTSFMPICDEDLKAIARTATNLEELELSGMSTVSIEGLMALIRASSETLRLLEHAPRAAAGFLHPHPGVLPEDEEDHICHVLANCPKLVDLSVSLPSMCAELFRNESVKWRGQVQVRAAELCSHEHQEKRRRRGSNQSSSSFRTASPKPELIHPLRAPRPATTTELSILKGLLDQCRTLITSRNRLNRTSDIDGLTIELFFASRIFDPHVKIVHGDFATAEIAAHGAWPGHFQPVLPGYTDIEDAKSEPQAFSELDFGRRRVVSRKGPYGSTGLYGKDGGSGWVGEGGERGGDAFEVLSEEVFLRGVEGGWVGI